MLIFNLIIIYIMVVLSFQKKSASLHSTQTKQCHCHPHILPPPYICCGEKEGRAVGYVLMEVVALSQR
jgi:hypothetical protein